ncbi:MAG: dynamin family protein [Acidimicrobiia bacterium]|nr:dynamin family protein [Acidimicrobiia bacterium]
MVDAVVAAAADLARAAAGLAETADALDREDLAARLRIAAARASRPATIVCVVGEFKQGKSSLVNALIGQAVCPVDDDLATSAITLIRYGEELGVQVRRREGGQLVVEAVDPASLADWVTEAGNPDNAKGVERVEIAVPSPLLASGLVLVDTPGMGGLGAGHAAATLAFLPFADGLIFVSDASAELSAPEVEFLAQAREACPNVVFALTKTDLHGAWRDIEALDVAHLARVDAGGPMVAVSAQLRTTARERDDLLLDEQSGFPLLLAKLDGDVVAPAKDLAGRRAATEAIGALDQLEPSVQGELEALTDPTRGAAVAAAAEAATGRLEHVRGPGARWTILVGDRITDLSNDVTYRFRDAMRKVLRNVEDEIEALKTAQEWDDIGRGLQGQVAATVADAFVSIETGAATIRDAVLDLLAEDVGDVSLPGVQQAFDVTTLWSGKPIDVKASRGGKVLAEALTGLRGAQSGIIMFGMMGQFLPAGIGVIVASNPVTLGLGAVFAGMQLVDAHKRKIAQRRQLARTNARQFADDVQFEVGNTIGEVLRTVQRAIRDEFTDRIAELHRTYAEAARSAAEALSRDDADRATRTSELTVFRDQLAQHRAQLDPTVGAPT